MIFFDAFQMSASGMSAQRVRIDTISQNLANVSSTNGKDKEPYRRKTVLFEEIGRYNSFKTYFDQYSDKFKTANIGGGVKVTKIVEDQSPFVEVYNPSHPDANDKGYVMMPNVNSIEEMTNLISANRSFEANVTAFNATKSMFSTALQIGK